MHTKEEVQAIRGELVRLAQAKLEPVRAAFGAQVCADSACAVCAPEHFAMDEGLRRRVVLCRNCAAPMEMHEVVNREVLQLHDPACTAQCAALPNLGAAGEEAATGNRATLKRCGCVIHVRPYAFCEVCWKWAKDPNHDPPHLRGLAAARRMLIDTPGVRTDVSFRQADADKVCAVCHEAATKVCRFGGKKVRFCSELCQRKYWKEHRKVCGK